MTPAQYLALLLTIAVLAAGYFASRAYIVRRDCDRLLARGAGLLNDADAEIRRLSALAAAAERDRERAEDSLANAETLHTATLFRARTAEAHAEAATIALGYATLRADGERPYAASLLARGSA